MANAELWVDKDVFADEMRALHAAGYTAVTLQQAWDGWKHGGPMPRKPIVRRRRASRSVRVRVASERQRATRARERSLIPVGQLA